MKRISAVILALVLLCTMTVPVFAEETLPGFGDYERVVILGIDGAGAFFDDAFTPNCDRIFSESSFVSHYAKAETSTNSAENWAAILCGVSYDEHRIDNGVAGSVPRYADTKNPSIFNYARQQFPSATLCSFSHWNPINYGIVENGLNVIKETGSDDEIGELVANQLEFSDTKLLFAQFDDVDHAGHTYGYGSQEHLMSMTRADFYIGKVYAALERANKTDSTLFIVVSDHGGTNIFGRSGGHGKRTYEEKTVFVAVKGKSIKRKSAVDVRNRDVAAIALYGLGIEVPEHMTGKVPTGMFDGTREVQSPVNILKNYINQIFAFISNFCVNMNIKLNIKNNLSNVKQFSKEGVYLTAHRGFSSISPENTLSAFENAGIAGFYAAECDIQSTKDGVWVICHDEDISRTTNGNGKIMDYTYEELCGFNIDGGKYAEVYEGLKLPTLEQYVEICRKYGMKAMIEIKQGNEESYPGILKILDKFNMRETAMIISFDQEALAGIRKLDNDIELWYLTSEITDKSVDLCKENGYALAFNGNNKKNSDGRIIAAGEQGIKLCTWTIDSVKRANELIALGVNHITTNEIMPAFAK